jgi:hypothetical protein
LKGLEDTRQWCRNESRLSGGPRCKQHPDRNAQFEHIAAKTRTFLRRRQPVISADTKKKELIGDFTNAGREWRPAGRPEAVQVHDLLDPARGKVIPYGVYDLGANTGLGQCRGGS